MRGSGIGRQLSERFEALARERGRSRPPAMTTRANAGSIQFHRRLGFSLLGEGSEGEVPVVRDPRRTGGAAVVVEERLR